MLQHQSSEDSSLQNGYRNSSHSTSQQSQNTGSISQQTESSLTIEQRFNKILIESEKLIEKQRFCEAVDKLTLLTEKINFLKQNKKPFDKKIELICLYNLASAYHKQWILDECIPLVDRFVIMLKSMIQAQEVEKASNQEKKSSSASMPHWYKMKHLLVKTQLQYCAILSQVGEYTFLTYRIHSHYKALKIAIEVTQSLKEFFNRGHHDVSKFLNKLNHINSKKASLASSWGSMSGDLRQSTTSIADSSKTVTNDKIEFAANVLQQAKQSLKELCKVETYDDIVNGKGTLEKVTQELVELKSKTYFWKDNPENNIKLLRKQLSQQQMSIQENITLDLNSNNGNGNETSIEGHMNPKIPQSERNLLGIKKPKSWIEQFTIAKVTAMSPINYLEFSEKDNVIYEFNYKNLIEKVILVSIAYFSLAIEIRYIEQSEKKAEQKNKSEGNPNNSPSKKTSSSGNNKPGVASNITTTTNSYFSVNKPPASLQAENSNETKSPQPLMKKSEVFHLKSIILLCKMIKENSIFLNHLVSNYHKHYKQDLITIEEQPSVAEYSQIYDRRSKTNSISLINGDPQMQYILGEDDEQNILLESEDGDQMKEEQEDQKAASKTGLSPAVHARFPPVQSAYFQDSEIFQPASASASIQSKSHKNKLKTSNNTIKNKVISVGSPSNKQPKHHIMSHGFKKLTSPSHKKQLIDLSSDQKSSRRYLNSSSKNHPIQSRTQREPVSYHYSNKYIHSSSSNVANTSRRSKDAMKTDRTIKKINMGKMITLGGSTSGLEIEKLAGHMNKDKSNNKSIERDSSISGRFGSMRSFEKKSFSSKSIGGGNSGSMSLGKSATMHSTTLKPKKRRGEKSPEKEKYKLKDLKESNEFKRADFKKKQKVSIQSTNSLSAHKHLKTDKKKQKLNNGLTLLKQSSSNPNLKSYGMGIASVASKKKKIDSIEQDYRLNDNSDYLSFKEKSRKR